MGVSEGDEVRKGNELLARVNDKLRTRSSEPGCGRRVKSGGGPVAIEIFGNSSRTLLLKPYRFNSDRHKYICICIYIYRNVRSKDL